MANLDLILQRNISLFIQLAALPEQPIQSHMQWHIGPLLTFIDVREQRLCLTSGRSDMSKNEIQVLKFLLQRCALARFCGIPQRVYSLRIGILITCAFAPLTVAECWHQIHQKQHALLSSALGRVATC